MYREGEWNPDPDVHVPNPEDEAKNGSMMRNKLYVNPLVDHFWWDWKSKSCTGRYTSRDGLGFSLCHYSSDLLRREM